MFTVSQTIQHRGYPWHPRSLIPYGGVYVKVGTPKGWIAVSYTSCETQPRNKNRLAGLVRRGANRALAGSISDFATLVRKSYSDALSPVSTLVLAKRTN